VALTDHIERTVAQVYSVGVDLNRPQESAAGADVSN